MLILYDDPWSPNCVKVRLVLREIEAIMPLKWRAVTLDLDRGEQHEKRFLRLNPLGRVPVLVDGGMVLRESGAILLYLAERFDHAHLLPPSTRGRADAYQWLFYQATELGRLVGDLFDLMEERERYADLVRVHRDDLSHLLDVLNEHLRCGRPRYLLGSQPCISDFALIASLDLFPDIEIDLSPWKMIQAYIERMHSRPSWRGVWPEH